MFQVWLCVISIEYAFIVRESHEKEAVGLWNAEDEDVADSWDADEGDITHAWDKSAKDHIGKELILLGKWSLIFIGVY